MLGMTAVPRPPHQLGHKDDTQVSRAADSCESCFSSATAGLGPLDNSNTAVLSVAGWDTLPVDLARLMSSQYSSWPIVARLGGRRLCLQQSPPVPSRWKSTRPCVDGNRDWYNIAKNNQHIAAIQHTTTHLLRLVYIAKERGVALGAQVGRAACGARCS